MPFFRGRDFFDSLIGSDDADVMLGRGGPDFLLGGGGGDFIDGGEGNDTIIGGSAAPDGSDNNFVDYDDDIMLGGTGDDILVSVGGRDYIDAGSGEEVEGDIVIVNRASGARGLRVFGQDAASETPGSLAESQFIRVSDGTLVRNVEQFSVTTTAQRDVVSLANMTSLTRTEVHGGAGGDRILTGDSSDTLYGDDGKDFISSSGGDDSVFGGVGSDTLLLGDGDDVGYGDSQNDMIDGGAGNDILFGGTGDDTVMGGAGDDTLNGGTEYVTTMDGDADVYIGGDGADTFRFNFGEIGGDSIADFDAAEGDTIEIAFPFFVGEEDITVEIVDAGAGLIGVTVDDDTRYFTAYTATLDDISLITFAP
ncbi:calcium-binding protein [Acuticoccus yangtzensis]|uniref:calcium-binding protein n=1 Tax=Acuticoccus yangtzensis TaxID=1443441 RepID=UPI00094985A7|nr:calcium-binding protein [Acuticoccus yangtzensis]